MFDIFYVGQESDQWIQLKEKYPLSHRVDTFAEAQKRAFTKMFWVVWDDLILESSFKFDYKVPDYDRHYIHVFKNGKFYDGVTLFPKSVSVSNRELDYRFYASKKEIDIQASLPKPFDVVFISFYENFADKNFEILQKRLNKSIQRVNGVKGIHKAHIQAATLASTRMFWVVDADAEIVPDFNFNYQVIRHNQDSVFVWRSRNPINNLEYGYGGVKLLPKKLTLSMDITKPDMTTSISSKFVAVDEVSNITAFNTDPFSAWRSAFRECTKLASRSIQGQISEETSERLNGWCTLNDNAQYGFYAYMGALAGRRYGEKNASNPEALGKINDFTWLEDLWLAEKSQISLEHKQ